LLNRARQAVFVVVTALLSLTAAPSIAATCENLASLSLPNTTITTAQIVPAGGFKLPQGNNAAFQNLPEFCRVAATLKPTSDSDIKIEVWLPTSVWNGKYEGVGNGGWAGSITYGALAQGLRRGYVTASTDTGHQSDVTSASFALGHPEKLVDYAWRSEHEMTVKAKAILQAFYGNPPKYSYWSGCSGGGKQGLAEAQKFPDDYNGIIAGASANNMVHLHAAWIKIAQAVHKNEASYIPPEKYELIHNAILNQCDALDGVKDGLLEDPTRCHFDPATLACKNGDEKSCLTAAQVDAAKQIFAPTVNSRTKKQLMYPLLPGSEIAWGVLAGPLDNGRPATRESGVAVNTYTYVIFKDPNWDFMKMNFDKDIDYAEKTDKGLNNANDPNLKPFFAKNGKLMLYHGYSDQIVPPQNSIAYYNSVVKTVGASKAADSIRLFMAPGMTHCGGGPGPNNFDTLTAMEQWVEQGKAPTQMIASHMTDGKTDRTRPLCPWPQVAKYKGSGSIDDAANFTCAALDTNTSTK
jgi:feruloyl esterase